MRLWIRSLILHVAFFIGAFVFVLDASLKSRWGIPGPLWLVGYLAVFMRVSYFVLRCPNCGKWAVLQPNWLASPFVGTRCSYCGEPY